MADERDDEPNAEHATTDDGLPLDPEARAAAVAAQFDEHFAVLKRLDERDTTEPPPQPPARPSIRDGLFAGLDASRAWDAPDEAVRQLASLFQSACVGRMRLDPNSIPLVMAVVAAVNTYVGEAVAMLAPPSDTRH